MSQLYILVEYTSERNNENFILSVIIKSYTRTIIVSLDQNSLIRNMSMTLRHPSSAFSVFFPHLLVSVSAYYSMQLLVITEAQG
jgi:hypothetical protein